MRPQAHCAASLLIWTCGPRAAWEAPLCVLCGNLPDLDRNVARALGVRRRDHHRWVSHSAAGWLAPTVAALALAPRSGPGRAAVRRAIAAVWIHLALDTYADGIAWLWPLREDKLGFFQRAPEIPDRGWKTPAALHTRPGRLEAVLWATAALRTLRPPGARLSWARAGRPALRRSAS